MLGIHSKHRLFKKKLSIQTFPFCSFGIKVYGRFAAIAHYGVECSYEQKFHQSATSSALAGFSSQDIITCSLGTLLVQI